MLYEAVGTEIFLKACPKTASVSVRACSFQFLTGSLHSQDTPEGSERYIKQLQSDQDQDLFSLFEVCITELQHLP